MQTDCGGLHNKQAIDTLVTYIVRVYNKRNLNGHKNCFRYVAHSIAAATKVVLKEQNTYTVYTSCHCIENPRYLTETRNTGTLLRWMPDLNQFMSWSWSQKGASHSFFCLKPLLFAFCFENKLVKVFFHSYIGTMSCLNLINSIQYRRRQPQAVSILFGQLMTDLEVRPWGKISRKEILAHSW